MLGRREHARGEIVVELALLIAVDRHARGILARGAGLAPTQQRPEEHGQGQRKQAPARRPRRSARCSRARRRNRHRPRIMRRATCGSGRRTCPSGESARHSAALAPRRAGGAYHGPGTHPASRCRACSAAPTPMTDETIRQDALEYHRRAPRRQDRDPADQAAHQPARSGARLYARRRRGVRRDRARSARGVATSRRAATWSASSPTARRCWASAPSARSPPSR